MPVDALAKGDGVSARKGEARNGEAMLKEGTRTYESFQHHASALPSKTRAPRMDLSKLTAKEQERWEKARARRYSALARQRRSDRAQDLRNQVEISSIFQVLVEAAPDAVLLLSRDERARILFANDQCGHLLRLDSSKPKGQALVGRSL
jgi:PAS domain-containing protein